MVNTYSLPATVQNPPVYFIAIEIFRDAKEAKEFVQQTFKVQTNQLANKVESEYKEVKEKQNKGEIPADSHIIFVWREMGITGQDYEFAQLFERTYFINKFSDFTKDKPVTIIGGAVQTARKINLTRFKQLKTKIEESYEQLKNESSTIDKEKEKHEQAQLDHKLTEIEIIRSSCFVFQNGKRIFTRSKLAPFHESKMSDQVFFPGRKEKMVWTLEHPNPAIKQPIRIGAEICFEHSLGALAQFHDEILDVQLIQSNHTVLFPKYVKGIHVLHLDSKTPVIHAQTSQNSSLQIVVLASNLFSPQTKLEKVPPKNIVEAALVNDFKNWIDEKFITTYKDWLNATNTKGRTLISLGVSGHLSPEQNKLLLEMKVDPDKKDDSGKAPIHYAIIHADEYLGREVDNLKLLREFKVDMNYRDPDHNSILHLAVTNRKAEIVKWILSEVKEVDPLARNKKNQTAMMVALDTYFYDGLKIFKKLKYAINDLDEYGNSFLLQFLTNVSDNPSKTKKEIALDRISAIFPEDCARVEKAAESLVKKIKTFSVNPKFNNITDEKNIKTLMNIKKEIQACDQHKNNLLHLAAKKGDREVVLWIIPELPINILWSTNDKKENAVHLALQNQHYSLLPAFYRAGINFLAEDAAGHIPLIEMYILQARADKDIPEFKEIISKLTAEEKQQLENLAEVKVKSLKFSYQKHAKGLKLFDAKPLEDTSKISHLDQVNEIRKAEGKHQSYLQALIHVAKLTKQSDNRLEIDTALKFK